MSQYSFLADLAAIAVNAPALVPKLGWTPATQQGQGVGTVAFSGVPNPLANISAVAKISTAGALGVGAFQLSQDGGVTYAAPVTIPASGVYAIPVGAAAGCSIFFAGASFNLGDTYSSTNSAGDVTESLQAASDFCDGFINTKWQLPLVTWGKDLVRASAAIAGYYLMTTVGYNPEPKSDAVLRQGYEDACGWLLLISKGQVVPTFVDSSTQGPLNTSSPQALSPTRINSTGKQTRGYS